MENRTFETEHVWGMVTFGIERVNKYGYSLKLLFSSMLSSEIHKT